MSDSNNPENIIHVLTTDTNVQFHFKPLRIVNMTKEYVTMEGTEGISNANISIRIPPEQFKKMCDKHPDHTNRFLMAYFNQLKKTMQGKEGKQQHEQ